MHSSWQAQYTSKNCAWYGFVKECPLLKKHDWKSKKQHDMQITRTVTLICEEIWLLSLQHGHCVQPSTFYGMKTFSSPIFIFLLTVLLLAISILLTSHNPICQVYAPTIFSKCVYLNCPFFLQFTAQALLDWSFSRQRYLLRFSMGCRPTICIARYFCQTS